MIPVHEQQKPKTFAEEVTKRARAFIDNKPSPTTKEIHNRPYWRKVLKNLHKAYGQVCAYSALWCPLDMATVDHFIPIHVLVHTEPQLAYDWRNFRLASRSMNTEKHKFQDVIDPFTIEWGWFVMDFPSLMIKNGAPPGSRERKKVDASIARLKLNEKEKYIEYRWEFLCDYCDLCRDCGNIGPAFNHLEKKAPFIAYELKRQGLTEQIIHMMKYPALDKIMEHYE